MQVGNNQIQFGEYEDPNKNFVVQLAPVPGGTTELEIRRGTLESPGALVVKFDQHGLVDPRDWVELTGVRAPGQHYVNDTDYPIILYLFAVTTQNDGYAHVIKEKDGRLLQAYAEAALGPGRGFVVETVIQPGWSYHANITRASLDSWQEFRVGGAS